MAKKPGPKPKPKRELKAVFTTRLNKPLIARIKRVQKGKRNAMVESVLEKGFSDEEQ